LDRWLMDETLVYMFDIDGVLVDVSEKVKIVLRKLGFSENMNSKSLDVVSRQRFWKLFLSEDYLKYDKPRLTGVKLLKDRLNKGRVVVITGRPENLKRKTLEELLKWGVPVHEVAFIFRRRGDRRRDVDFKLSIIAKLRNVVEVHDDAEDVLKIIKTVVPNAKLYLHFNDDFRIYA